jgi:hypothetical protein
MGAALLAAAEADARARGRKGIAAWGLSLPIWMRASWFRRHGFVKADRSGLSSLVWKRFTPDAVPPRWLSPTGKRPDAPPGRVVVTGCLSGWCPVGFQPQGTGGGGFRRRHGATLSSGTWDHPTG